MSIFEETGGGLGAVAHDRSLELFFDRFEVIARFVALINEDPAVRRVLYLHGLGGNGKSLLLRYLAARCCVRLQPSECNEAATPYEWKFTPTDLNQLLHRIGRHDPATPSPSQREDPTNEQARPLDAAGRMRESGARLPQLRPSCGAAGAGQRGRPVMAAPAPCG